MNKYASVRIYFHLYLLGTKGMKSPSTLLDL